MDDKDTTGVLEMIKDLHSDTESYHIRDRDAVPLRYSVYSGSILDESDASLLSTKRRKLNMTNISIIQERPDCIPTSPWEWRRLKAEVKSKLKV